MHENAAAGNYLIPRQYLIGLVDNPALLSLSYTPLQRAAVVVAAAAAVHFSGDVVVDFGVVIKYGDSG